MSKFFHVAEDGEEKLKEAVSMEDLTYQDEWFKL